MRSIRQIPLLTAAVLVAALIPTRAFAEEPMARMDDAAFQNWFDRWKDYMPKVERDMKVFTANSFGETLGWQARPQLDAYCYAYLLTRDPRWITSQVDVADAFIARAVKEPDGYPGWPSKDAFDSNVDDLQNYDTDSMAADAMLMRPLVILAREIIATPALAEHKAKAESYLKLSEQLFEKWEKRGGWRDTKDKTGVIPVYLPFGLNDDRTAWLPDYDKRNDPGQGVSMPNFKANAVARWMLAMFDATKKPVYRERAEKWFTLFKSRLVAREDGTLKLWPAWEPAGPWDYKPDGTPKDKVGPGLRPGWYEEDLIACVEAYEHGIVFNKDHMLQLAASVLALQKEPPPPPLKAWPGYWYPLVPFSAELQKKFEAEYPVGEWSGVSVTPRYLLLQKTAYPDLVAR